MRKIFYILLLAFITPSIAWGVDQQTYTDPNELPAAFEWNVTRYDYYATGPNQEQTLVATRDLIVRWNPSYQNASGSYGKLEIENFYKHAKTKVCNLTFDNTNTHNFKWDGNICTFSLNSYYYANVDNTTGTNNATLHSAFINSAEYKVNSSVYWVKPSYVTSSETFPKTNYKYGGNTALSFRLDLATKSITIENSAWGAFMCKDKYGANPSNVLDYYVRSDFVCISTDLVDIVNDPEIHVGDEVTVDDDLLAVACLERNLPNGDTQKVLFAKDFNKFLNPDVNTRGADDFLARTVGPIADQSNWVALTYDDNPAALLGYQGLVLKGGSIKGTLTDKTNPAITLSALPTEGAATAYTPNTYIAPSFCDEYASDESPYFFVQPKPQEYCYVMWADYNAATNAFYVPALGAIEGGNGSVSNPENLSGGFGWNDTYLRPGDGPIDRQVFNFNAVVNKISYADTYNVWVHTLNGSDQLMEDGNTHIYAWKGSGDNKTEYCGPWPGTALTDRRTDSTGGEWYYYSFGNTCPDGIIFNYPGKKQSVNIEGQLVAGDNFFNYYPEGADGDNRYWNLTGQYSRQQAPRRAQQHDPKVGDLSERYVVMPLQLDVNSVVTAVADVRSQAAVASVRYVDAMGRVSATPHRGINIVVTRHTDGTTSTRKVVM